MILTIDIGNSTLVACLIRGQEVVHRSAWPTQEPDTWFYELPPWTADHEVDAVGIASVVPWARRRLAAALEPIGTPEPLVISPDVRLPVTVDYQTPDTLGADRLAAASALVLLAGGKAGLPGAVVDAGTAVTIEVVDGEGRYLGGTIGPGPRMMADSLAYATASLPDLPLDWPDSAIGKSSVACMQIGVLSGFVGAVASLLDAAEREAGPFKTVLSTGGWGGALADRLPRVDRAVPDLVGIGIASIVALNTEA